MRVCVHVEHVQCSWIEGKGHIALAGSATTLMLHRLHNPFTQMAF